MSIPTYRAVEPLYIVMLRNNQAEPMFKTWIRKNQIEHATVNGNKMMLHHQQAFDRFLVTWAHEWNMITVWDTWNRRHIYVD
jgi:phosphopantetheine adenylyltransferase